MTLSDPQSLSSGATLKTLNKVVHGASNALYRTDDGRVRLTVRQDENKRNRSFVRLDYDEVLANPLTGLNQLSSMSVSVVIDRAPSSFSTSQVKTVVGWLAAWLAGSEIDKVLAGQS